MPRQPLNPVGPRAAAGLTERRESIRGTTPGGHSFRKTGAGRGGSAARWPHPNNRAASGRPPERDLMLKIIRSF